MELTIFGRKSSHPPNVTSDIWQGFGTRTSSLRPIAAELLKLVERAVLDPKKEGKPWLREGNFDRYIFKKSIHMLLDTRRLFFLFFGDRPKKAIRVSA